MKQSIIAVCIGLYCSVPTFAQESLTADSCRRLALEHNKELLIGREKIEAARYTRRAATTHYLPSLSLTAGYVYNQKETSILSEAQREDLSNLGAKLIEHLGKNPHLVGILQRHPALAPLVGSVGQQLVAGIGQNLNQLGSGLADATRTDTHHVFAGAMTLTQPIFMGGKIRAYNKISRYAESLAQSQYQAGVAEVILNTDQAYWQVVSLVNKKKLATNYRDLLQRLEGDVEKLIAEGVATRADLLAVRVKLSEAESNLAKVEDGLSLSRMLLCQLCGLDLEQNIKLADEGLSEIRIMSEIPEGDVEHALSHRPELRSLGLASDIYRQKINVARAEYLPSLALVGNYLVSNPTLYNGFENKFGGMWNVGVVLKVPLWHWGQGTYKVRAAKAEARIAQHRLSEVKEKVALQVSQANVKVKEANKRLVLAVSNMERADENLRYADLSFREGLISASQLLEAQTAWLSAESGKIDAQIDIKLTALYLKKVLGDL